MRKILLIVIVACLTGLMLACSGNIPPVPVIGTPQDLTTLAGEWTGRYEVSDGTPRHGEIYLNLNAGTDTARGSVLLTVRQFRTEMAQRDGQPAPMVPYRPYNEAISIKFVRVKDGRVTGILDPYRDPYCGCTLTTTFTGRMKGDTISGNFRVRHSDSMAREAGRWRVIRQHAKAAR
jgi:hypothetical protein